MAQVENWIIHPGVVLDGETKAEVVKLPSRYPMMRYVSIRKDGRWLQKISSICDELDRHDSQEAVRLRGKDLLVVTFVTEEDEWAEKTAHVIHAANELWLAVMTESQRTQKHVVIQKLQLVQRTEELAGAGIQVVEEKN